MYQKSSYTGSETYIKEDHHSFVKQNFVELGKIIAKEFEDVNNLSALDVGSATGALIGYLKTIFPSFTFTGVDNNQELLDIARIKVPSAEYLKSDARELVELQERRFDVITCLGVLGIFNPKEVKLALFSMLNHLKDNGTMIIFTILMITQ